MENIHIILFHYNNAATGCVLPWWSETSSLPATDSAIWHSPMLREEYHNCVYFTSHWLVTSLKVQTMRWWSIKCKCRCSKFALDQESQNQWLPKFSQMEGLLQAVPSLWTTRKLNHPFGPSYVAVYLSSTTRAHFFACTGTPLFLQHVNLTAIMKIICRTIGSGNVPQEITNLDKELSNTTLEHLR